MWRPNLLSIDLMMDELLNQSIRKSIQDSPYLKSWVNPEDMRRDVRSGLSSGYQNDIRDCPIHSGRLKVGGGQRLDDNVSSGV